MDPAGERALGDAFALFAGKPIRIPCEKGVAVPVAPSP